MTYDTPRHRGTEMFDHDPVTERIIACAIEVHRLLGPGFMESTYEEAMCIEMSDKQLQFTRQVRLPLEYKGHLIGEYRPDLVVENKVVVEIKSVERLVGVHRAQVLTYMRALNLAVGLLINFNGEVLKSGVRRLAL